MPQRVAPNNVESQSRYYTAKIINGAWEKSPAYQKLTYDAGAKLLDQKWSQYIGYLNQSATSAATVTQNAKLSKTLNMIAAATSAKKNAAVNLGANNYVTAYATTITLPASTQHRLNQHREWIKKFKADVDFNNNVNNKI
jgi:hypothetical protein